MKTCTKCGIEKPFSEFYAPKGRTARGGAQYFLPSCKQCFADYYKANSERQRASSRANNIKKRYGLTVDQYDALVAQGCSICGETEKRIVMDHCHSTNSVRKPLCDLCNVALGSARDDPALLRSMAEYLERHTGA